MKDVKVAKCCGWTWLVVVAACCWLLAAQGLITGAPPATGAGRPPKAVPAKWTDPAYIEWLEKQSMLYQARQQALPISGHGAQWGQPYAEPQPHEVVKRASVWVLGYPGAVITRPGKSVIATWADPELWDAFQEIGIELLHTGPVKRAGGIEGKDYTPSIDGWFDRISLEIDPQLGTEKEYRRMVAVAAQHDGLIAGDLVPLHSGKGADFRLAQRAYKDYPGMYTMVEVRKEDWPLLPKVAGQWASAPVPKDAAEQLTKKGYIPGLIHSCDASPDAHELSGWDATGEVPGVDGKSRRWVYLHYFKPGQPTLNWLDPSFAGPRAIVGDVVKTVSGFGTRVVRLDAVPFLGIERRPGFALSWHYQHPLSVMGTNYLAFLTRKLGGWSFHELNVPLTELKVFTEHGPDLSYDFFTRTECVHSLLTGDATILRQAFHFLQEAGVKPIALVHDLQNHDEITYQLVELDHRGDETFTIHGNRVFGRQLREQALREMRAEAAGSAAPYNKLYRPARDGVATTFAGFIAASLDIRDPYNATAAQREQIKRGHLLLAMANAMQPGVFSLSSWDLVGALPLPEKAVADRMQDGDYRWINRGAVDLMDVNPDATKSAYGLPKAKALYGALPQQLQDPDSFVSQLKRMLAVRKEYRIAEAELIRVPEVKNSAVCLLVLRLPGRHPLAITALNFGRTQVEEELHLGAIKGVPAEKLSGRRLINVVTGGGEGKISDSRRLTIKLAALAGKTLVIESLSR